MPAVPPVVCLVVPKPAPLPPVPPKASGDWWLTRSGRVATCATCKCEIPKYAFRLIHHGTSPPELLHKAPSYMRVHREIKSRKYHHVAMACLPEPPAAQEVTCRDDLIVDIAPLPKSLGETGAQLLRSTEDNIQQSLIQFRLAGHNVAKAAYMKAPYM